MSRSVFLLTVANFIAMGSGFLREVAVAYHFGTSAAADAFAVNFLFVESVSAVAAFGLGSYMMVPIVNRVMSEGPTGAEYLLMETLCLWLVLVSLPLALAGVLWPHSLVNLLGSDFAATQQELLISLIRISIPSLPLLLISGVVGGVLQARADYFTPVLGRALFSMAVAGTVILGTGRLGVVSAAYGILLGALVQLLLQLLILWNSGWHPSVPALWHSVFPRAVHFGLPALIALLFTNMVMGNTQRFLASGLPEGSLAAINYAQRILSIVANLSLAIGTVSLTELSIERSANSFSSGRTSAVLKRNIESGLFLLTPFCILLFLYSDQIAVALYQRGQFGAASAALTASCLRWFTFSVIPAMVLAVLLRVYPAIWRPWSTAWISLFWTLSTILGTAILLPTLQTLAVPAAYSMGVVLAMFVSALGLCRTVERSFFTSILLYITRLAICGTVSAGFIVLVRSTDTSAPDSSGAFRILPAVLFVGIFALMCAACRDRHISLFWNLQAVVWIRRQFHTWL